MDSAWTLLTTPQGLSLEGFVMYVADVVNMALGGDPSHRVLKSPLVIRNPIRNAEVAFHATGRDALWTNGHAGWCGASLPDTRKLNQTLSFEFGTSGRLAIYSSPMIINFAF